MTARHLRSPRWRHSPECKFRKAADSSVAIACEPHGKDVCAICDPCTCSAGIKTQDFADFSDGYLSPSEPRIDDA